MEGTPKAVSLCTMLMDRYEFLKGPLESWLRLPFQEIIMVDWGSNPTVKSHFPKERFLDERIHILEVKEKDRFHINKARNLAVRMACGPFVMVADQDIILGSGLLDGLRLEKGILYTGLSISRTGTSLFSKELFSKVNGFHERMIGAGAGDCDFYNRCCKTGAEMFSFEKSKVLHVDHDPHLRTKGYDLKEFEVSNRNNYRMAVQAPWTSEDAMEEHKHVLYARTKSGDFLEIE